MTRKPLSALVLALGLALSLPAAAGPAEDARARNALRVLQEIRKVPDSAIPERLLDEARAIVVVPDALKVGLIFGGRRGHGLLSVKNPDGTWSAPSFVRLTGGSVGFQAGVQSADIVLVFRSDRGLDSIVNGKVTLGADAAVAAGPVGRSAATATDGQLKAEIWSWSRARGLFAGVALDGAVLAIDDKANEAVYGRDTTPRMIFEGRTPAPSTALVDFRDGLEEASAAARSGRATPVAVAAAAPAPVAAATSVPATTTVEAAADSSVQAPPAVKTEPLP